MEMAGASDGGLTVWEGRLMWTPTADRVERANITTLLRWFRAAGHPFADYEALWRWSVTDPGAFWGDIWDYFDLGPRPAHPLADRQMPGAVWFCGATVNYTREVFRHARWGEAAMFVEREAGAGYVITWDELADRVGRARAGLRRLGVSPGDRVAGYLPNTPEAVVAFLATASLGAVWSCCSPDFGSAGVLDRLQQIEPTVLIAVDGYQYGGRVFDRRAVVRELAAALPTVRTVVRVAHQFPDDGQPMDRGITWEELLAKPGALDFDPVPFNHPLWILYSSGTTGLPKPIVQSQGGILLTNLLNGFVHMDLGPSSRFFWFTTTGWMMWNTLVGGLLAGSTIVLYDGSPTLQAPDQLFRLADRLGVTFFGTSAAYLAAVEKSGVKPAARYPLAALEAVGSTGSPLAPSQFAWVYQHVKSDVWLTSASGGTDVCTKLVGGIPTLPVYAGELQCRCLGMSVEAFDDEGRSVVDQVGELVITAPIPSMPIYFWNDPDNVRYREAYFEQFPGVWRHGDWIKITRSGAAVIYGRSDATINRHGIRLGSAEIYRVVEALPSVRDSLVVDLEYRERPSTLALFVVMNDGYAFDEAFQRTVEQSISQELSPRHVPDVLLSIAAVPRTLNGKKLEVPIRRMLLGTPLEQALTRSSVANPEALEPFVRWAQNGLPATRRPRG